MIGHQIYLKLGIFPLGHHFPCWVTVIQVPSVLESQRIDQNTLILKMYSSL